MRSLLAPLVIGLVLSLAAVIGVQWSMMRVAIDRMMEDFVAGELASDVEELYKSLVALPGAGAALAVTHFDPPLLQPGSGRYCQVLAGPSVVIRSPSLQGESLPIRPAVPGEQRIERVVGPQQQSLLVFTGGYTFDGRPVTISAGADMQVMRGQFQRLLEHFTEVSLLMFALLVALQVTIVRFALMPLRRVQSDMQRLDLGEITALDERVPREVLPLVREINRLFALLNQRLRRSREALANLAHALKAPVTVLTHIADDDHLRRQPELRLQMKEQLETLGRRIDTELRRARVAGGRSYGAPVDIAEQVESLAATLRKLYRDRHLDIVCRVQPGARFHGDREDLLELCGNLMDNACKWAHHRVLVAATNHRGLCLLVADDGPGCSPEELGRIGQRGVRLDESIAGHGLGLAIAEGIAGSYGSRLQFGTSAELGGFEVMVEFPPAS